MENLKPFTHVTESEQSEKTENIGSGKINGDVYKFFYNNEAFNSKQNKGCDNLFKC